MSLTTKITKHLFEASSLDFSKALHGHIRKVIGEQRKEGIESMSADNLWQMTAGGIAGLPGAPAGTNAAWAARQTFNDILRSDPAIKKFLIESITEDTQHMSSERGTIHVSGNKVWAHGNGDTRQAFSLANFLPSFDGGTKEASSQVAAAAKRGPKALSELTGTEWKELTEGSGAPGVDIPMISAVTISGRTWHVETTPNKSDEWAINRAVSAQLRRDKMPVNGVSIAKFKEANRIRISDVSDTVDYGPLSEDPYFIHL